MKASSNPIHENQKHHDRSLELAGHLDHIARYGIHSLAEFIGADCPRKRYIRLLRLRH